MGSYSQALLASLNPLAPSPFKLNTYMFVFDGKNDNKQINK